MKTKRVLVLKGRTSAITPDLADPIIARLREATQDVYVTDSRDLTPIEADAADIAVVLGGDGTFLGAARRLGRSGIPVVGINMGRMGFLTEFSPAEFNTHFHAILTGKLTALPRMMLEVCVRREGKICFQSPAMNEVSIVAGEPFRMIELAVRHNEVDVCTFVGDGLVLATPTGSTAYTLSAGGPILMPGMQAIAMTPVAAHSLSIRPVVMTTEHPIHVTPLQANPGTTASIDGQIQCGLVRGDTVEIIASENKLLVVQNPAWPFFRTLMTKLKWAHSPHHHD